MANLIRKLSSSIDPMSPWGELGGPRTLRRELDRLFDDFFSTGRAGMRGAGASMMSEFVPSLELTESDDAYLMRVELPGMSENDVQVEIDDNNMLVIRGEKKKETQESRGGYEYSERSYGQFVRTVQLPNAVDAQQIKASFENGVLQLDVPKSAEAHPRAIPIASGGGKGQPKKVEAPPGKTEKTPAQQPQQPARH